MRIDVWSDVVCPWCFLGKRRLERALAELPWGDEARVRFRAFELDPDAPREPTELRPSLVARYGAAGLDAAQRRLISLGAVEGIEFRFATTTRVNTLTAHRLLAWAAASAGEVVQAALQDRLMLAYFTHGANLADTRVLADLAGEVGLDAGSALRVLGGDEFAEAVRLDIAAAQERGIGAVPAVVIEDRFLVSGAQEAATFVRALEQVRQRLKRD